MVSQYYTTQEARMPILNHLNAEAVCADFGISPSLQNIRSVQVGKALVTRIRPTCTIGTFAIPFTPDDNLMEIVSISRTGVYCTCYEWRKHHHRLSHPFADSDWLCLHGAALRLYLEHSPTFQDWLTLPKGFKTPTREPVPPGNANLAKFHTVITKNPHIFGEYGLDLDTIKQAYYRKYGVTSLSTLTEYEQALIAAEVEAMKNDKVIMAQRSAEMKARLKGESK